MNRALVIKTYGDKQIAEAIVNGIVRDVPKSDAVRRVAMHQHTPEEWAQMIADVVDEREQIRPVGRVRGAVLGAWALVWSVLLGMTEFAVRGARK